MMLRRWAMANGALQRRGLASLGALEFLVKEKKTEPNVAKAVLKSLEKAGMGTSDAEMIAVLKSIGDGGVEALVKSVQVEEKETQRKAGLADVQVTVKVPKENHEFVLTGKEGDSLFDLVKDGTELAEYLECACSGLMSCSTCHVYVNQEALESMEPPEEAEMDMLDLAWGYEKNSRLGCQLRLDPSKPKLEVTVPDEVVNYFR